STVRPKIHSSIDDIDPVEWNALAGADCPFLRHEFLAALEHTGCIGADTGWEPCPVTLSDDRGLAAAAPAYIKTHSYGEFVFDFAWAQAYARHGRRYYPKLVIAVPFTPATGPRLLVRSGLDPAATAKRLLEALESHAVSRRLSSVHALFVDEPARAACEQAGWLLRRDCQFHWSNRGYPTFDAYLETFTAEKRFGSDLDERLLDSVYAFHRDTFLRHGNEPYLSREFFSEIARTLGDALMVKVALHRLQDRAGSPERPVAAAIFFWSEQALYGRYWGAAADYHSLHFEACYHQGIEF